jgi:hypothetical protein
MRTYKLKKCRRIQGLSFAPGGRQLLVLDGYEAHGIETARWLDRASGEPARTLGFLADQFAIAPDHSRLVIATERYPGSGVAKLIQWLDARDDSAKWQTLKVRTRWPGGLSAIMPQALALTPDAKQLMLCFGQQRFPPGSNSAEWTFHLAVCPFDPAGTVQITDLAAGVRSLAVAPSGGRWAASTILDGRPVVALYDQPGAPPLHHYRTSGSRNLAALLTFSPTGRHLAALVGRSVVVLAADTLARVAELSDHPKQVSALAFTPDGRQILTAAHDGLVRTWDAASGAMVKALDWQMGALTAVTLSADGLSGAAAGLNGKVVVWDVD